MRRNFCKQIEQGDKIIEKNERLDLYGSDLHVLLDKAMETRNINDFYDAVINAYKAGIAVGTRNGLRQGAKA